MRSLTQISFAAFPYFKAYSAYSRVEIGMTIGEVKSTMNGAAQKNHELNGALVYFDDRFPLPIAYHFIFDDNGELGRKSIVTPSD